MNTYTLQRLPSADDGTFGTIEVGSTTFHTAELPWLDNKQQISCIPVGTYTVEPRGPSAKFKYKHYHITNVAEREMVLIHVGNYAGDTSLGYKSDVLGCIIIGDAVTSFALPNGKRQRMVTNSRDTFAKFRDIIGSEAFKLTIK